MQIVPNRDNLQEMSNSVFWEIGEICMKCQILFSGKNKNNIANLMSAELAQSGKG